MKLNIELTAEHRGKLLKMFEYYYSNEIQTDANYALPDIDDNGLIEFSSKQPKIHWYEFVSNILIKKILDNNYYWLSRYVTQCIHFFNKHNPHPVDFAYDKFMTVINKEPLIKKQISEIVEEKENKVKEKKKGIKTKLPGVNSEDVISSTPLIIREDGKTILSDEDFFN